MDEELELSEIGFNTVFNVSESGSPLRCATVEELVQMMTTVQGQQHAFNQEISRLTTENQQFRQRFRMRTHDQVIDKVWSTPPTSKGESARFTEWLRKTTGFLIAAYSSTFRPVVEWVEGQGNIITNEALDKQFGPLGAEPVGDVQEKSEQVHVALLALRESESFDIVLGAAPSGLEALRRLVRRLDLASGGRRRALRPQILVPDRCKLQDLPAGLQKWEELVRRYERRNRAEQQQQLWMRTSRQLLPKTSFQVSWNSILP